MSHILFVISSPRGEASHSTKVARALVDRLQADRPGATVTVRDLARAPLAHIGEDFVAGLFAPPESQTAEHRAAIARSDALIDEVVKADIIVIASAMINFAPTSTLKSWIDYITRSGKTFRYGEGGAPEGLIKGKKVYLVTSRGGIYSEGPMRDLDFQEPYLKHVLAFLGMTDVEVIAVEGVAFGSEAVRKAEAAAFDRVSAVAARAA